jgi:hypothetical protein
MMNMNTNTIDSPHVHNRTRLLNEILDLNPGSDLGFLSDFSDVQLEDYRDHLHFAQLPRSQAKPWDARTRSKAICFRDSDL